MLTAIGLTPGGSSTVHIYTQTIHRTTQLTNLDGRLYGIRSQSGQTKINDELNRKKHPENILVYKSQQDAYVTEFIFV